MCDVAVHCEVTVPVCSLDWPKYGDRKCQPEYHAANWRYQPGLSRGRHGSEHTWESRGNFGRYQPISTAKQEGHDNKHGLDIRVVSLLRDVLYARLYWAPDCGSKCSCCR